MPKRRVIRLEEATGEIDMTTRPCSSCADEPESTRGYNPGTVFPPFHQPQPLYREAEIEALKLREKALKAIK